MSAIDMNRMATGPRPVGIVSRLLSVLTSWNDRRMTRNLLSRLSDHELEDIGLSRGDIDRVARGF